MAYGAGVTGWRGVSGVNAPVPLGAHGNLQPGVAAGEGIAKIQLRGEQAVGDVTQIVRHRPGHRNAGGVGVVERERGIVIAGHRRAVLNQAALVGKGGALGVEVEGGAGQQGRQEIFNSQFDEQFADDNDWI